MQLSASAVFFGLVTGLLGVWLFLWQADRQHEDYRVNESRVACDKARFDAEFAGNFGSPNEQILAREKAACGEMDKQITQRTAAEEKSKQEAEQLKQSIQKALQAQQEGEGGPPKK